MRKLLSLTAFLCIVSAATQALPKVAVLDIIAQKGIDTSAVVPVTESLMEEVVAVRAYVVLDRAYVEQVLKEQEFVLSGLVSDTQVAQAGQYLGADYVVTGKVQLLGESYFLVAKMIEVRTGVIVAQSSEEGEGKLNVLLRMAHSLGKKLVRGAPISPLEPVAKTAAGAAGPAPTKRITAGFGMPAAMQHDDQSMV
jgi:TolB-like protein